MATTPPVGAPIATWTPDVSYGPKPTNEEAREESFARLGLYTGDPDELPEELRPEVEDAPAADEPTAHTPQTTEPALQPELPVAFTPSTTGAVS